MIKVLRKDLQAERMDYAVKLLLFVFSPFISFLYSLVRPASRSSYLIYFLFGVVFCWNMDSRGAAKYDDFIGIKKRFLSEHYTTSQISTQIEDTLSSSPDAPKELFENILNWATRQISDNYHLFFALASIFYLSFMLSSLKHVTNDRKFKSGFYGLLLMALFVIPRDVITVQNPRYTIGFWYSIMCILCYFNEYHNNKKLIYAVLLAFAPFFHSGFWPFVFIFYICLIASKLNINDKLSMTFFLLSIPFSFFSYDLIKQYNISALPLPANVLSWAERYLSEDSYQKFSVAHGTGLWLIGATFNFYKQAVYVILPYLIYKYRDKNDFLGHKKGMFAFFMILCSIINFMQPVPVIGTRYGFFIQVLSIYMFFKLVYPSHKKVLLFVASAWVYPSFMRYLYTGAVSVCVPPDIWFASLPYLIYVGL